ncbi:MAG: extracellular solute-binding protein [Eubacteriales bacterium]|nr:extracellular solute-binding protein [Oscillospiraceae bacterium]MDO4861132.1 extracellular solute-binding protein [Eubacteriales bacterium]
MKKILAMLLALVMIFALAACGQQAAPAAEKPAEAPAAEAPAAEEPAAAATGSLKIWVPEATVEFTKAQVAAFMEANPEYAGYEVSVEPVGEGDAASNMLTDVEAGADIFNFAQDQLARLVSAGALIELSDENAAIVAAENDAGSVAAATMGGTVYAYPLTSDNGYFLYYDKSVVTDPTSLSAILADCEAAGKDFYMEINSGWYQPAFFFGAGCTLTYDTDDAGAFTACNIDYASDKGVGALKAMIELAKSPAFKNGSSVSNATNVAAIVDGTWDSSAAKELFGDNYACAKLPTVDINGTATQLGGFGGFKLLGVKPQTDEAKLALCDDLALFLSSGDVQLARYEAVGWGPSNIAAKADPAVQADEALAALGDQLSYTIPQGQYPGDYWGLATALGDSVIAGEYNNADDAALLAALQNFQDTCIGYAG